MRIVVDLVGLCYLVCIASLADFDPLVLESSMGLGSRLLKTSYIIPCWQGSRQWLLMGFSYDPVLIVVTYRVAFGR